MVSAFVLGVSAAMAVPAKPGVKKMLTLKDGSRVEATLRGDEHVHFYEAADGRAFQMSEGQWQQVDRQELAQLHTERLQAANQRRAARRAPRRIGTVPEGGYHGTRRGLVIMVEFTDRKFIHGLDEFNDYFNKVGYNSDGMQGSVHDYFLEQSYGMFDLEFDIVGPVALENPTTFYAGENSNVAKMVNDVCKQVDDQVDFTVYDWDNDGTVDQVYVIYAGYGAAQGAQNTIWPHEWSVRVGGRQTVVDGVKIDTYGISCELMGDGVHNTGHIDGVGTSCHEFSHCLGLPDFYDTSHNDGTQGNFGMGGWSLMDSGCYNGDNNGHSPCGYTAYERWWAGWLEPVELKSGQQIVDMPAIQDKPVAYIMYNDAYRNEYYMLENYQFRGFDAAGEGHGLLVLHVDYDTRAWNYNTVNNESDHQRMTIIAADNVYSSSTLAGDPFPGRSGRSALTNTGNPKATLYNENVSGSKLMDKPITRITEKNGQISFIFMGGASLDTPLIGEATDVTANGFTANWGAVDGAESYTILLTKVQRGGQTTFIFEEDFEKFTMEAMTEVTYNLDDYTELPGWSGKNLYGSPNKLRVGKVRNAGELQTPVFNAPLNDSISILLSVYNAARLGTGNLELRIYPLGLGYTLAELKSMGYYMYLELSDIPPTSEEEPYALAIRSPWAENYGKFIIGIYTDSADSGIYMDYLGATDGLYEYWEEAEENEQPAALPASFKKAKSVDSPWICNLPVAPLRAKAPRRAPLVTTETFTSATNSYTFSGLHSAQYSYSVRAHGDNGIVSDWSDEMWVDLTTGVPTIAAGASVQDAATYDLSGRRLSGKALPRGLYIRNGRKFVIK